MRNLMKYKMFESTNWGNLANTLVEGYYSKVSEENNLPSLISDVEDVILPLSDMCEQTELTKSILITVQSNPSGKKSKTRPLSWVNKGISQISTDGKIFHTVRRIHISTYDYSGIYSKFVEVKSLLSKATQDDTGWFSLSIYFKRCLSSSESNRSIISQRIKDIMIQYEEIKYELQSRGWTINPSESDDEYIFDTSGTFGFDIVRPISLKLANSIVPDLMSKTITILSDKDETYSNI